MDTNAPASTPDDTADLRSAIESAWNETQEDAPDTGIVPIEAEQPATDGEGRARDEKGRFSAKGKDESPETAEIKPSEQAAVEAPKTNSEAGPTPPTTPPPGWSVAAKAEFDNLPPAVREAVAKRESEINQGFAKLADYKSLDPYVETARKQGTNLPAVIDAYMRAENLLSTNFVSGVRDLCRVFNINPAQLAQELGHVPGQAHQQPAQQSPLHPVLEKMSALEMSVEDLRQQRESERQQREKIEEEAVNSQIAQFSADPEHRYFENVRPDMYILLKEGRASTLEDAYEQACWLNPDIRAMRIKEAQAPVIQQRAQAVNQARLASKSLPTSAPLPGAISGQRASTSVRSAIEDAWSSLAPQI